MYKKIKTAVFLAAPVLFLINMIIFLAILLLPFNTTVLLDKFLDCSFKVWFFISIGCGITGFILGLVDLFKKQKPAKQICLMLLALLYIAFPFWLIYLGASAVLL